MKFARKCSVCNSGMNDGYVIKDKDEYFCSTKCLFSSYFYHEYQKMMLNDAMYWTEWDVESDAEYEMIDEILTDKFDSEIIFNMVFFFFFICINRQMDLGILTL